MLSNLGFANLLQLGQMYFLRKYRKICGQQKFYFCHIFEEKKYFFILQYFPTVPLILFHHRQKLHPWQQTKK